MTHRLPAFSLFAGILAMAGLPIYIHAPKFYVDQYGVSLAALGGVLFVLRLIDVVQDPFLGWLSRKFRDIRSFTVAAATCLMAVSMIGLFAVTPPVLPVLWFALTLALLFSSFSFLTINFYAQGVSKADELGEDGHVKLAGWRETGALLGVSLAAVAPILLQSATDNPFALFAVIFAALCLISALAMRRQWKPTGLPSQAGFGAFLSDPIARRLLIIALVNAAPVAASSTLFLFFVERRLEAAGWEGPLLLLFFMAAAASAPVWSRVATIYGAKLTLISGMILSILAFGWALFLGPGDALPFAIICIASGAALGADMTLLPALFAERASKVAPEAAEGFGLWSFVTKLSLAFAAVVLLPLLDASGFTAGTEPLSATAATALTAMYAGVPCVLKLAAIALLAVTELDDMHTSAELKEA